MLDTRPLTATRKAHFVAPASGARIAAVGTATPPKRYTQDEVLDLFREDDPKMRRLFRGSHIKARYMYLPDPVNGAMPEETHQELLDKHLHGALEIGPQAIEECLLQVGLAPYDIDFLCCLSTTGFLCPG